MILDVIRRTLKNILYEKQGDILDGCLLFYHSKTPSFHAIIRRTYIRDNSSSTHIRVLEMKIDRYINRTRFLRRSTREARRGDAIIMQNSLLVNVHSW